MQKYFEKIKERLAEKFVNDGRGLWLEANEIVNQVAEETNKGEISDGYHTFNELYHHRAVLFAVICNSNKEFAWKSMLHDTGDMYDGMFIVGIETPEGQATYHYDINPYWDMFQVKELPKALKWDGHTPDEAIRRIATFAKGFATDTNVGSRKLLDSLHEKILKSKFAEEVTEAEIEALVKTKNLTNNNQSLTNDGWIPCSERLPTDGEVHECTAQFSTGMLYIEYSYYDIAREEWWAHDDTGLVNVIAWREHPAPYQPKGE